MSLQRKMVLGFVGLIILPLLILGTISYEYISNRTEERHAEATELTLRALLLSVDQVFQDMNNVTDSAISNRAIQDALTNLQTADLDQINYLELNEIQRNFRELLVNHPSVSYAFMYSLENKDVYKLFSKASFSPPTYNEFVEQPIYQDVIERDAKPKWIGPYESIELTGADQVFTMARVVKDIDTLENKGILLVQIRNSDLESIFRYFRYKQEHTNYMILNKDGLVLYDSEGELQQSLIADLMPGITMDELNGTARGKFQQVDSVVTTINYHNNEGWKLIAVTPRTVISGEISLIALMITIFIGISIVFACVFILTTVGRTTKAIVDSVSVMREVERGHLKARVEVRGNDEIGLLTRGTNSLISRLEDLIQEVKDQHERKRVAEIAALQAQIKPHFLFNTLESINILAIQNQGKKVSQIVAKLGNILRISMQPQDIITIEQELAHVRSYLDIQKFRFEELFEYEINVDPSLLQEMTLKLSLQPLIENCIQHGFEGIEYLGLIRLTISDRNDYLAFEIEDNGIGISAEQLAKFNYLSTNVVHFVSSPEYGERRSIGVQNVADRIRLHFGMPYGLIICSAPDYGTKIVMTIPKKKVGVNDALEGTIN